MCVCNFVRTLATEFAESYLEHTYRAQGERVQVPCRPWAWDILGFRFRDCQLRRDTPVRRPCIHTHHCAHAETQGALICIGKNAHAHTHAHAHAHGHAHAHTDHRFCFRRPTEEEAHSFHLFDGDCVYMFGDCQDEFEHCVMKSENEVDLILDGRSCLLHPWCA